MLSCPARKQSISKTGYIKESGKECHQENHRRRGEQPHPPVRHPACQERPCGRGNRLPSVRPPRLRISPALQPDVQEAGGGYAVGVLRLAQSERKVLSGIRFYCIHLFHHRSNESVTLTSSSPNVVFKSACEALSIFPNRVKFHELVS